MRLCRKEINENKKKNILRRLASFLLQIFFDIKSYTTILKKI